MIAFFIVSTFFMAIENGEIPQNEAGRPAVVATE